MGHGRGGFWNDAIFDRAKHLWGDGYSASQIFRMIGAPSRSAVLAKLHRAGLSGDSPPQRRRTHSTDAKTPKSRKPTASLVPIAGSLPEEVAAVVISKRTPLELAGWTSCRFPLWAHTEDGRPDLPVCGNHVTPGESWCAEHRAKVFRPGAALRSRNKQAAKDADKAEAA